jgi:uncharacterized Tic20 family protein
MTTLDTTTPPLPVSASDRLWCIVCHLSGVIGAPIVLPLIVYLVMKQESAFVTAHAKEALNFHLSLFLYALLLIPLYFIGVGFLIGGALFILYVVLSIMAAIKSSENLPYRYPITIRFVLG